MGINNNACFLGKNSHIESEKQNCLCTALVSEILMRLPNPQLLKNVFGLKNHAIV